MTRGYICKFIFDIGSEVDKGYGVASREGQQVAAITGDGNGRYCQAFNQISGRRSVQPFSQSVEVDSRLLAAQTKRPLVGQYFAAAAVNLRLIDPAV